MQLEATKLEAYQLLHDGALALLDAQQNGIPIDIPYIKKQQKILTKKITRQTKDLNKYKEIKKWKKVYGKEFNLDSHEQLSDILFEKMGHKAQIMTKGGKDGKKPKPSTSQTALETLNIPVVNTLTQLNRLKKVKDTYLVNYINETVDGLLHPFFHLHRVITFRSSSSNINFQNQPNRIEALKKIVRNAVRAPEDYMIGGIDYSGIEVSIAYCYHNDPAMREEITNPARDMHRDMAMECFMLNKKEWTKMIRYCGKNMFVFPQFYGDYYVQCATNLWNAITNLKLETAQGIPLKKHLKSKGIKNYRQFENHVKKVEDDFWGKRFKVYKKWKEKHYAEYCKNGYVDMKTGFRCSGLMSRNDAINYPVQGAAFHCLLWSFIQINKWLKENNMKSMLIGQIHDEVIPLIHKDEVNEVLAKIKQVMTVDVLKHWKWITVPLEVEIELAPVGSTWYQKKEVSRSTCKKCKTKWRYKKETETVVIYTCPVCGHEGRRKKK